VTKKNFLQAYPAEFFLPNVFAWWGVARGGDGSRPPRHSTVDRVQSSKISSAIDQSWLELKLTLADWVPFGIGVIAEVTWLQIHFHGGSLSSFS
jgi:hypothetical protein